MARSAAASIMRTFQLRTTEDNDKGRIDVPLLLCRPSSVLCLSPPQCRTGAGPGLAIVGDRGAIERAIERGEHAALDEIERRRLAVARARQLDVDLLEQ